MSWDSSRPIPWKRLGIMLGGYAVVMTAVTAFSNSTPLSRSLPGIVIAMIVVAGVLIALIKFGWKTPMLMSRAEQADARAQRIAQRQATRGNRKAQPATATNSVAGPRTRPAPTSRTTTGPSQHPRRNVRKK